MHILNSTPLTGQSYNDDIEELLESTAEEAVTLNQNLVSDFMADIKHRPLNLNSDDIEALIEIQLLNPIHISALRKYIAFNGPLISIYELQSVPFFEISTIRAILPYVFINANSSETQPWSIKNLKRGKHEMILRWGQTLQYQPAYDSEYPFTQFKGNKSRLYFRYRYQLPGKLYLGLTGEKDPGETIFKGSNPYGFDFYSFHLFIKEYKSWLPKIAIGDFSISMGHGLIINSGFTLGKSALTTRIINARRTLRQYSSVNESNFMRGIAFELSPVKHLSLTLFYSNRKIDASVRIDTAYDVNGKVQINKYFSSIQASGNHRTDSEISNQNQVRHTAAGGTLQLKKRNFKIALNLVRQSFDIAMSPRVTISTLSKFRGRQLTNISLSYQYSFRNLYLFGETAMGQNGVFASTNGFLMSMDKKIDIVLLTRHIPASYQQIGARSFGESSSAQNESGVYIGTEIRPNDNWTIHAYADIWKHKEPRFGVNSPGQGNEQLLRITYQRRHHSVFYIQYRHETKDKNSSIADLPIDQVVPHSRQYLRIHFNHKVGSGIELRNRVEFSLYNEPLQEKRNGVLMYQDLIFKPLGSRFTFTTRVAFFDTDDYLSRIYAYENDLNYQFSVPAYTYRGVRYYLNLKYTGLRNIILEGRIAHLRLSNRDAIGSGNLQIEGNAKTDVKVQVTIRF